MEFDRLLEIIGDEPVFETALLLAGDVNPRYIRIQLARWTKGKRIVQLRRGLYAIAPPFQKNKPHPFLVANRLQRASYVSMQTALAFYGLIPETVNITVSVTTGRPERLETPVGIFEFHHIKTDLLYGYQMIDLGGQHALVATPEKALLDLVYLQTGGETLSYIHELRLQNLEQLNSKLLNKQAEVFHSAKLHKAAEVIVDLIQSETREYEEL
jgi:predicted transcriptional regulator of viral defense system